MGEQSVFLTPANSISVASKLATDPASRPRRCEPRLRHDQRVARLASGTL
jgi:hypothetical protein